MNVAISTTFSTNATVENGMRKTPSELNVTAHRQSNIQQVNLRGFCSLEIDFCEKETVRKN